MITTKQIENILQSKVKREHHTNYTIWLTQNETSFVAYAPRWGWTVHLEAASSGYADTLEEAEKAVYLKLLERFDALLERQKRLNYIEFSIEHDNSLEQTCQDLEMIWVNIMA